MDLQIASAERHERFVRRVVELGSVWGLFDGDGWCVSPSNGEDDNIDVMPFWSDRAYAAACAKEDWSRFRAESIPIEEFLEAWLPGMAAEGVLVGTNWNAHLVGAEVDPVKLKEQLLEQSKLLRS